MSVNIKLGDNVVTNVETISLEDADNLGQRISFDLKGEGYTVKFISEGKAYATYTAAKGQSILAPSDPIVEGKNFNGWFSMETGGEKITFPVIPTTDVTYYAQHSASATVIGFTGLTNGADPTPDLIYTDDIANVGKYTTSTSGTLVSVSNPLDEYFPYNQISEFTDASGNTFVKFPKIWMKWVKTSTGVIDGIKISDTQADPDYFIPDCFIDPKSETEYLPYFALGKYEGSGSKGQMYSKPNQPCLVSLTRAAARGAARSYGTVDNHYAGYQQMDFSMLIVYNFLTMLYYKTSNIQRVYAGRTSASNANNTGSCDKVTGMNGWNTSTQCVKMLGVENPYGNVFKWVDGVMFRDASIFAHRLPQLFADSTSGGTNIGVNRPTFSGFIVNMKSGTGQGISYCYANNVSGGSQSTYYGDNTYYGAGERVLSAGGVWNYGSSAGLWYLRGSYDSSRAADDIGCRLAYRPVNE